MRCFAVVLVLVVGACGGKIAEDPDVTVGERADPRGSAPPRAAGKRSPPAGDACTLVCERAAMCGALQTDCIPTCQASMRGGPCAAEVRAYFQCHAENLADDCGMVPPVCESAYCGYTTCTRSGAPDYCR